MPTVNITVSDEIDIFLRSPRVIETNLAHQTMVTVPPAVDPTTDMRADIQDAIDAAAVIAETEGFCYVRLAPNSRYRVTTVNSPSSGTKAGGAYGLQIKSNVRLIGAGDSTVIEIHAGGSFGTGVGISPYGMLDATDDYGAASNVLLSDFRIESSGSGTDPSSGNLLNLVHCQDWEVRNVSIGQSYYHGLEMDQSRRIKFIDCKWSGPHSYSVSGSWIQFDNGDAGPRSTVPTTRLVQDISFYNCSFTRPDTDAGAHDIELFHSLSVDLDRISFKNCYFKGRSVAFTSIMDIGSGVTLDSSQYLKNLLIDNCIFELRHPRSYLLYGLQSSGMQMNGIKFTNNKIYGNSGTLLWLGGSSSAAYNDTHSTRTGLEIRNNRYDFNTDDWGTGYDMNLFIHVAWNDIAFKDNIIKCVGDLPSGSGQNYSSLVKVFSCLDTSIQNNHITWDGDPTTIGGKTLLWIDNQLTDAASTTKRFIVRGNFAAALSGAAWSYGILTQRGTSPPSGSVTTIEANYGAGSGSSANNVLSTGFKGAISCASYTVATLPTASLLTGNTIYVSNESGGATLAFSDGTNWRRVADRAVVS